MDVGEFGKRRFRPPRHRDQLRTEALDERQDRDQFFRFAGIRERDKDVVLRNHAEIAVARFRGMHEKRGCACARERRGELAGDMAGFADAGYDDAAAATQKKVDGCDKALVDLISKPAHGVCFDV